MNRLSLGTPVTDLGIVSMWFQHEASQTSGTASLNVAEQPPTIKVGFDQETLATQVSRFTTLKAALDTLHTTNAISGIINDAIERATALDLQVLKIEDLGMEPIVEVDLSPINNESNGKLTRTFEGRNHEVNGRVILDLASIPPSIAIVLDDCQSELFCLHPDLDAATQLITDDTNCRYMVYSGIELAVKNNPELAKKLL